MAINLDGKNYGVLQRYIVERERIRLRRFEGKPWPWTYDPILRTYKFTNVKRAFDRTTMAFQELYMTRPTACDVDCLMSAATFRYFGTIDMAQALGFLRGFKPKYIRKAHDDIVKSGGNPFTGAYIIPQCGQPGPKIDHVLNVLNGLYNVADGIVRDMLQARLWRVGYERLTKVFGFAGKGFMAKEVLLDFMMMTPRMHDEETWTPMGPGARRGLNRIMGRKLEQTVPADQMLDELALIREDLNLVWTKVFAPRHGLSMHDVQWNLCEIDKYLRVLYNEGRPRSYYTPPDGAEQPHTKNGIEVF